MLIFSVGFSSCDNDDQLKQSLKLSVNELHFAAVDDKAKNIEVAAENVAWDIDTEGTAEWVHISKSGNFISVSVDTNEAKNERNTEFTVTSNISSVPALKVTVKQAASDVRILTVDLDSLEFEAEGNEPVIITVTSQNVNWDIDTNQTADWLKVSKGEGTITVTAENSTVTEARNTAFTNTSDDAAVPSIEITASQKASTPPADIEFEVSSISAEYNGAWYSQDVPSYGLYLHSGDAMFDLTKDPFCTGTGYVLFLEFASDFPENLKVRNITIPSGEYIMANYGENDIPRKYTGINGVPDEYAYTGWRSSALLKIENGEIKEVHGVIGGKFVLDGDRAGESYTVNVDVTVGEDLKGSNDQTLRINYKGAIPCPNKEASTLAGDVDFSSLTFAEGKITYFGDFYDVGSEAWTVQIWSEGISFDEWGISHGQGTLLIYEIFGAKDANGFLPEGKYVIDNSQQNGTVPPGVLLGGVYMVGCQYHEFDGETPGIPSNKALLVEGTITVGTSTAVGDKVQQRITFDTKDNMGNKVTGTANAAYTLYEYTESPGQISAKGNHSELFPKHKTDISKASI